MTGICGALQSDLLPSWIEAIATCGAFVAASVAGLVAYRIYGIERKRDDSADLLARENAAMKRQEQASKVTFWFELGPETKEHPVGDNRLVVANASGLPVNNVAIGVEGGRSLKLLYLVPLPEPIALSNYPHWIWEMASGDDAPAARVPIEKWVSLVQADIDECVSAESIELVFMEYTDSGGRKWRRRGDGSLTELD